TSLGRSRCVVVTVRWPLPSASIHTKRPQIERTFLGAGVRDVGDLANERRRRNPSTRSVRQLLGYGRRILCPHAMGHSSGTGKCADWCHHNAWNPTPQIRPSSTASPPASLLVGRYGRLVRSATSGPVCSYR